MRRRPTERTRRSHAELLLAETRRLPSSRARTWSPSAPCAPSTTWGSSAPWRSWASTTSPSPTWSSPGLTVVAQDAVGPRSRAAELLFAAWTASTGPRAASCTRPRWSRADRASCGHERDPPGSSEPGDPRRRRGALRPGLRRRGGPAGPPRRRAFQHRTHHRPPRPARRLSRAPVDRPLRHQARAHARRRRRAAGRRHTHRRPTTLALAELDETGSARYRFYERGDVGPGLAPEAALAALPPRSGSCTSARWA